MRNIPVTGLSLFLSLTLAACDQMDGETTDVDAAGAVSPPVATLDGPSEWMTPWGHPDLQGIYTFATNTPIERPDTLAGKDSFTPEELEALEASALARRRADVHAPEPGQLGAAYNSFWTENETGQLLARTSLITDPENGKLPPLTENGQAILDGWLAGMAERTYGEPPFTQVAYRTWFDLPAYERCVARPMPRIWQAYNHGVQILQTPDHVVVHYESMHDARIIALDDRPPLHEDVRFWNGSSRGRFEGDTLIIETANYAKQWMDGGRSGPPIQFPMDNMRITERFRRLDENTLSYEITVEDPTIWTRPWTLEMPWVGDDPNYEFPEHLYEFACHEGNYRAMEDTIRGSHGLR